ncbi:MAG: vWA domain-containing protein [Planctomycetaceae bacterium]|nr:vWA domain-containing protein [Planctomycetaceae bacterium]
MSAELLDNIAVERPPDQREWTIADPPPVGQRATWVGVVLSLLFHGWLIGTLSGLLIEGQAGWVPQSLESRFDNELPPTEEPVEVIAHELANPHDQERPLSMALNAASVCLVHSEFPKSERTPGPLTEFDLSPPKPVVQDIPEGQQLSDRVVVPGTTGEAMIQLDAALDRVTWEIARHLQERRVLVVWLLDASGSLAGQRVAIQRRLQRIYGELGALERADQFAKQDRPLLTGVVAFGQGATFLTKDPTDDFAEITNAFAAVQNDPSGVENTFSTVSLVMDRWSKYRVDQGRRILLVTVTDEAGDDYGPPLDLAIARCRKYGALAYVIGPASPFGKRRGYVPYVAPEDKKTYQLPVDLGPECIAPENVELPFWYDGPQYGNLSSGFGPYALSRLVKETGGVYFVTNMTTMAGLATVGTFDPHLMKAFEPDYRYGSSQEFLADLGRHPLRAAVFAAAQYSQTTKLKASGTPRMSFALQPNNFRTVLSDAQKTAAITQLAVDSTLAQMPPNAEKFYDAEPSLRWRLSFSLNYGRLLAQRVRATEYNAALAELKGQLTEADVAQNVNRLTLRPDRDVHYAGGMQKVAKTAQMHLERVIAEAPGTPWAVLAARELKDGFGIRVVKGYVAPPPPAKKAAANPNPKPRPKIIPETKPAPPPKPPVVKAPPVLPKL